MHIDQLNGGQVDIKNIVKSSKHFFGYFNTLETHSGNGVMPTLRVVTPL